MQTSFRNGYEFCHCAVYSITKSQPMGIEIVKARPHERRIGVKHGSGLAGRAISQFETGIGPTGLYHAPGKLVPEHNWIIHLPTIFPVVLVQVAAANSYRLNFQEHIVLLKLRHRQLSKSN